MKKTIYKTIIMVEILSESPIEHSMLLSEIASEGDDGCFCLSTKDTKISNKPFKGIRAVRELENQGSYAGFFNMDEKGNEENY
jgi:hypothetical protein